MTSALEEAIWLTQTLPIRLFGDPVLTHKCQPISADEFHSGQAQAWAAQLDEFMQAYREHTGLGRGLAANQIGISKQLIWIWNGHEPHFYANPVISGTLSEAIYPESCISGASLMIGDVKRPWQIEVTYQDLDGQNHSNTYDGLTARLLQHEIDHLRGKLCTDHYQPGSIRLATGGKDQILVPEIKPLP